MTDIVNPLLVDDGEEDDSGLPDLGLDFLDAGDFSAPAMVEGTDPDSVYPINYDDYAKMDEYRDEDDEDVSAGAVVSDAGSESVLVGDSLDDFLNYSENDFEPDDFSTEREIVEDEDSSIDVEERSSSVGDSLESLIGFHSDDDAFHDFDDEDDEDEERYYTLKLDDIITKAIDMGASDIDLSANDEVSFSILGNMKRIPEFGILNYRQINNAYEDITSHVNQDLFIQELELDTSYEVRSGKYAGRRLRLNVAKSFDTIVMTFRVISNTIPTPDELGIDERLLNWIEMPNGLVLVNGSTGQGKALRLDTKIPTPAGFTTMGEIKVGDTIYDSSMNECNVEWISEVNDTPELYKITFKDGQIIYADKDHQWIVSSRKSRNYGNTKKCKKIKARALKALDDANSLDMIAGSLTDDESLTVKEIFKIICDKGLNTEIRREDMIYKLFKKEGFECDGRKEGAGSFKAFSSFKIIADSLRERFVINEVPSLRTMTTKDMIDEGVILETESSVYRNFAVPVVESEKSGLPDIELPIDPYLLGVWLGDGSSGGQVITSGINDLDALLENVKDRGYDVKVSYPNSRSDIAYVYLNKMNGGESFVSVLKSEKLFNDKHVPYIYLTASYEQRLDLLRGLMDTDGYVDTDGVCELSLTNERLADDVSSLIRSLGIRVRTSVDKAGYKNSRGEYVECGQRYRMRFVTAKRVFNYSRKLSRLSELSEARSTCKWNYIVSIEKVENDDPEYSGVMCIGVDSPDHSYLCADYVVTHNSTTLASMIREIQLRYPKKIITVEKPVEYVYGVSGRGVVHQREVGRDTRSFGAGLDSAMRQHPDVILIGEVRNKDEANALLYAADTGHLTFSTMHTNSAADTLNRIKRMFSGEDQVHVLGVLSEASHGFVNQLLVRTADGKGRFAVREILDITDNDDVKDLIRHGNVRGLRDYQMEHRITMEHELLKAVESGQATARDAYNASPNRSRMADLLRKNGITDW